MTTAEPQSREEIEEFFREKLAAGEADTGLYDVGLSFVVVDRVGPDQEVTFHWFDQAQPFNDLLR